MVALALEEWSHWLEGAEQHFIVWTDHKNLYLHSDCKGTYPTSRALFLGRFIFTLTYRPGYCYVKPDALFCQTKHEQTTLPPSCVLTTAKWDIEQVTSEIPENVPENKLFVPEQLRSLVQWSSGDIPRIWPATPEFNGP